MQSQPGLITTTSWWIFGEHVPALFYVRARTNGFSSSSSLALTASLKASQISSELLLLYSLCAAISSRVIIQNALVRYIDQGNSSDSNWVNSSLDIQRGLGSGANSLLLQAVILPKNDTGPNGTDPLVKATGEFGNSPIALPIIRSNGSRVNLGDADLGYPPSLYPNFTYSDTGNVSFQGKSMTTQANVLLGPYQLNASFALLSITIPVVANETNILGYMTVVVSARQIYNVFNSQEGLANTGILLLAGPNSLDNRLPAGVRPSPSDGSTGNSVAQNTQARFIFPPMQNSTRGLRHQMHSYSNYSSPWPLKDFPAFLDVFTVSTGQINNAGSILASKNEQGDAVAVGYALIESMLCNWALVIEQDEGEAFAPIHHLRNILLACVFGTTGGVLLFLFPIAHYAVRPIRRLRAATKLSVEPRHPSLSSRHGSPGGESAHEAGYESRDEERQYKSEKGDFMSRVQRWRGRGQKSEVDVQEDARRRNFHIPGKVLDRKHIIQDELTDLTKTFNEMTEELVSQYERLEVKVQERTHELELSKKAAEAANESKTRFVANISHELKTPLNGILGMCAVLLAEEDMTKVKRSLRIVYNSGDLLLHLLTDLLTFSKNQIGQQLSLEEKEFHLADISAQIMSIFDRPAKESKIKFKMAFQGPGDLPGEQFGGGSIEKGFGPPGTGRVRDMCLWGDQHRILQVLINLVSNSFKFTPAGQSVEVRIRCLGEMDETAEVDGSRRTSIHSRRSSQKRGKNFGRVGSSGSRSSALSGMPSAHEARPPTHMDTALRINALESMPPSSTMIRERSATPPPPTAGTMIFEFEVEDTGPGIPENQQERVFEPFMQGELGLNRKFGGTGLGLSICSQLASLMKGTISLRSQPGVGSTFTMRIPLKFTKLRSGSSASSINENSRRSSFVLNSLSDDTQADIAALEKISSNSEGIELTNPPARLVGLSQPYFTDGAPINSAGQQMASIKKIAAEMTKTGDKVRVLVAEDNKVNQEVVLRMLKLEDIYGQFNINGYIYRQFTDIRPQMSRSLRMAKRLSKRSRRAWAPTRSSTWFSWTSRYEDHLRHYP